MARSSTPPVTTPLGSLTQSGARTEATCEACGSERVTHLSLTLTDGSAVQFVSCHRCEHRTWSDPTGALPVDTVLDKTRKVR
jgi:transcription elongation factor Elf1